MKRKPIIVLFSLISLLTASCTKMDKLFKNGEPVTEYRSLDRRFNVISIYNNVNVKLVRDNHVHVELTCPENLIEKITTEIDGDTLVIKNQNEYNWLRSFDYSIDMTVYFDSLCKIKYASIGTLFCSDSLHGFGEMVIDSTENGIDSVWTRKFDLNINEGCGDIDLTFSSNVVKCNFGNGTSKVTLRGKAAYTELLMRSYGVIHAEELESIFVRVQSHSTNDAYVWAKTGLRVWLYSGGNVYYRGHPWVAKICNSSGQVFRLE